ncbi:MAG: hypothetical protein M1831_002734 [Alyxoria varia]|nr:MAG: hypothetical protein M1831_002734 [Alyxoria varia]
MDYDIYFQRFKIRKPELTRFTVDLAATYKDLAFNSDDQFIPTPISALPTGNETGRYLVLDIGGTNLRVGFIDLLGKDSNGKSRLNRSNILSIPILNHFKVDKAEDFFTWIGGCIVKVVSECQANLSQGDSTTLQLEDPLPVGISWSFPMIQRSISDATLMPMGKGFAISNETNLSKLLLDGYARYLRENSMAGSRFPSLKVAAITNDTVATFAALSYVHGANSERKVAMGLIVGTGTNAAIVMKKEDLHSEKTAPMLLPAEAKDLVVNTEWSLCGAAEPLQKHGFITDCDKELDYLCENPGFQPFEYMAGGRYLGELVRIACLDFFLAKGYIETALPKILRTPFALDTMVLSNAFQSSNGLENFAKILETELPPPVNSKWHWTAYTAAVVRKAIWEVSERSAKLIAAAVVAGLLCSGDLKMEQEDRQVVSRQSLVVAYTGGVISTFPGFKGNCATCIIQLRNELCGKFPKIFLEEVQYGGPIGAAVLAGIAGNLPSMPPSHVPTDHRTRLLSLLRSSAEESAGQQAPGKPITILKRSSHDSAEAQHGKGFVPDRVFDPNWGMY